MSIDISKAIGNNAYMQFSKFPELTYYIKTIQVPVISTGVTTITMPQHYVWNIPSVTGDVEDITIMWYLDENYITYFNLVKWLRECRTVTDITTVLSDATITVTNNAKQPIIDIYLKDTWVYNLDSIDFDTYNADPSVPFFSLKCHGFSWKYLDSSLDKYNGMA